MYVSCSLLSKLYQSPLNVSYSPLDWKLATSSDALATRIKDRIRRNMAILDAPSLVNLELSLVLACVVGVWNRIEPIVSQCSLLHLGEAIGINFIQWCVVKGARCLSMNQFSLTLCTRQSWQAQLS